MISKKTLQVITSLDNGGAEKNLFNLLYFNKSKFKNHLIISLRPGGVYQIKLKELGYEVISFSSLFHLFFNYLNLIKKINVFQPDVIQGWMYHGNFIATFLYLFCKNKKIKLFWNIRQTLYSYQKEKILTLIIIYFNKFLSFLPNKIISNSKKSISHHIKFGFENKFYYIPNSVDTNFFYPSQKIDDESRKKLKISKNIFCISLITRYHKMKNHLFFLKCAKIFLKKKNKVCFLLIGKNILKFKKSFFDLVDNQYKKNFLLFDEVSGCEVRKFLNISDIVCITSDRGEGMSNILLESYACGTKVLSSDVGDNKNIILEKKNIFKINNQKNFLFLLKKNTNKKRFFKKNYTLRNYVKKKFSLEKASFNYNKLYNIK